MSSQTFTRIALFFLCCLAPIAAFAAIEDFSGKVVGVSDGDTITVLHDRTPEKIRLHGIDCPEAKQAFGTKAKQFTSKQVFGQVVTIRVKDKDRYGRTVGEVVLSDGRVLNHELVKAGFAWHYVKYARDDKTLAALEREAREHKRGLWADPVPVAPWAFRKNPKPKASVSPAPKATTEKDAETVYITKTGKKFHRGTCSSLRKSKIKTTRADAKRRGLTPCGRCKP